MAELVTRDMIRLLRRRINTMNALLIRELMVRFGHDNMGFLWLVGEPLILMVGVMAMWSIAYGEQKHGVPILPMVLTGYAMLTVWRHMVTGFMNSFRHNAGLFFHRRIRPFDVLVAKGLLETVGTLIAFFVAYVPLVLLEFLQPMDDFLIFLTGWVLMCSFSFGVGMITAGLSELSETAERLIQPVPYLTLPLTGSFFMVAWLPHSAQEAVLYSPMVHATEMLRGGYYGESVPTTYDPMYLIIWTLVVNAVGLALVRNAQNHIEVQ